jgi:uncharacterized protein YegL
MKKGLTEIVFILDRSGSMAGLEHDTIGGFNALLAKQKALEGEAILSTVLFDTQFDVIHNRMQIAAVKPITEKEYFVRGSTALLDAIGRSIQKIGEIQKHTPDAEKAEKVLFIITTDGMENASREYTYPDIKRMIERQTEKYDWEFIFLGANIDAAETAGRFGIHGDRSANFHSDVAGTQLNYSVLSDTISELRTNKTISNDWKDRIDTDFNSRKQ